MHVATYGKTSEPHAIARRYPNPFESEISATVPSKPTGNNQGSIDVQIASDASDRMFCSVSLAPCGSGGSWSDAGRFFRSTRAPGPLRNWALPEPAGLTKQ